MQVWVTFIIDEFPYYHLLLQINLKLIRITADCIFQFYVQLLTFRSQGLKN